MIYKREVFKPNFKVLGVKYKDLYSYTDEFQKKWIDAAIKKLDAIEFRNALILVAMLGLATLMLKKFNY